MKPFKLRFKLLSSLFLLMPVFALALDFKSIGVDKAITYDAPATTASKKFILSEYYPVEILVDLGAWLKVRDIEGAMYWIEAKAFSKIHTVLVRSKPAELRQEANISSSLVATVEPQVALILLEKQVNNGWLKVKSLQGLTGYIQLNSVWGF